MSENNFSKNEVIKTALWHFTFLTKVYIPYTGENVIRKQKILSIYILNHSFLIKGKKNQSLKFAIAVIILSKLSMLL